MSSHSAEYELAVLNSMIDKLPDYLEDDRLFKTITAYTPQGERLLKMTLGGIFQHIGALERVALDEEERDELAGLIAELAQARQRSPEQFYKKLSRELKSYIDSWHWFLQNCWDGEANCAADYPQEIDLRLRVDSLLRAAGDHPSVAEGRQRIAALDEKLRAQWQPGAFILGREEHDRYPESDYWWLYGRPRPAAR